MLVGKSMFKAVVMLDWIRLTWVRPRN